MDASDWIAIAAVVVAVVSGGGAIIYARRSAAEAKRSADHAGAAVVEARRSADEAKRMRELDEERRHEEKQRWHVEREPRLPGVLEAEYRESPGHGPGYGALWGTITVPHAYRVRAFTIGGGSWSPIAMDVDARPGQPMEFMIERWQPDKERVATDEVVFRFWPPLDESGRPAAWRCDCGERNDDSPEGRGHWERRVKVSYNHGPNIW